MNCWDKRSFQQRSPSLIQHLRDRTGTKFKPWLRSNAVWFMISHGQKKKKIVQFHQIAAVGATYYHCFQRLVQLAFSCKARVFMKSLCEKCRSTFWRNYVYECITCSWLDDLLLKIQELRNWLFGSLILEAWNQRSILFVSSFNLRLNLSENLDCQHQSANGNLVIS